MSHHVIEAKTNLMRASKYGTPEEVREARKTYETVRAVHWIYDNAERLAKADIEQLREAFDNAIGEYR